MIVEYAANKTAIWMKKIEPERTASKEVLEYGLKIIYNTGSVILLSTIISLFLGSTLDVIIGLISFVLLRFFSGGYHLKSSDYCILVSTALIIIITLIPVNEITFIIFNLITIVMILIFAPSGIQSQLNIVKKYNSILKIISLSIVLFNFIIIKNEISTVAFLVQAITLFNYERKMD